MARWFDRAGEASEGGRRVVAIVRAALAAWFLSALAPAPARAIDTLDLSAYPRGLDVPGRLLEIREREVPRDPAAWGAIPDSGFHRLGPSGEWSGFRPGHVLLRLLVSSEADATWWVLAEYVDVDSVRAGNGRGISCWVGEGVPRERWCAPWHAAWIPVRLRRGVDTVHLEIAEWTGRLGVSVRMQPDEIRHHRGEDLALRDGLFVGILLANLLFACGLFVVVRLRAHFWYLVYQAFVIVFVFSTHHHSAAWLWPSHPDANQITPSFGSIGAFGALALFLSHLLDLRGRFPRAGAVQWWAGAALLGLALLQLLIPVAPWVVDLCYGGPQMELLEIASYVLGFVLAARLALARDRLAAFVCAASVPMLLALGLSVAGELVHLPWIYSWRSLVVELSMSLENTLLGLLLAHRVWDERRRHGEVLERLLAVERDFNERIVRETDRHLRGTALDLHDGVGQDLAALRLQAETLGSGPEALARFRGELDRVAASVRAAAHGLYPPELKGGDLNQALVLMRRRLGIAGGLEVEVEGRVRGLAEDEALQWYRIAQEAVQNAHRHGKARRVRIRVAPGRMEIEDDGGGCLEAGEQPTAPRSIQMRAAQLGCGVLVEAAPGGGCRVVVAASPG